MKPLTLLVRTESDWTAEVTKQPLLGSSFDTFSDHLHSKIFPQSNNCLNDRSVISPSDKVTDKGTIDFYDVPVVVADFWQEEAI